MNNTSATSASNVNGTNIGNADGTRASNNASNMNSGSNTNRWSNNAANTNSAGNMNNMSLNNGQAATGFAAIPVLETYVPDNVVAKLKQKYGANLYDLTMIKRAANQPAYIVRVQDNGAYKTEIVNDNGDVQL